MEIFCLGEYYLFDILNMYCKVWKWHYGKKWMCATVLWKNWSLAVNILEDIAKHCLYGSCKVHNFLKYQLSSWLLPIVQLQGMCFVKSQLCQADCCPYSSSRLCVLWNLNCFQQIAAHMAVAGYVFCEISTLSSWFNRSVHLKQEHSS